MNISAIKQLYSSKTVRQNAGINEWLQKVLIIAVVLFLVAGLLLPLLEVLLRAFTGDEGEYVGLAHFIKYFSTPYLVTSLYNTVFISTVTTIISVIMAFVFAYALIRTNIPGRGFFRYIALLPLFAPTMMHGISLIYLFGNKGLVTTGLFGLLPGLNIHLYGPVGIIISEVVYTFPQAFLILSVALSFTDYRLYEAAEILGAGSWRKFFTVTLPNVKFGLLSAAIVSFTMSFTDFGAPKIVGGYFPVLATDMYKQVIGQQNMAMGSMVGIILLLPAVVSFIIDRLAQRKQSAAINAKSIAYRIKAGHLRDSLLWVFCLIVGLSIALLMGTVLLASVVKNWPYNFSVTLNNFSFANVAGYGLESYFNSIAVALFSAVIGTTVIFVAAYLAQKSRQLSFGRQVINFTALLPLALPGMIIGLAYIFFFNKPVFSFGGFLIDNPLYWLYGSMWLLVLVNIIHFFSVPFITAVNSLKKLDDEFELVGESLAVPFYRTFAAITLPLAATAIFEIFIYLFVNSMVTISAVIFLYAPDFKLASIAIVNMDDAGDTASAAAMSTLILLTNVAVRWFYDLLSHKLRAKAVKWQLNQ